MGCTYWPWSRWEELLEHKHLALVQKLALGSEWRHKQYTVLKKDTCTSPWLKKKILAENRLIFAGGRKSLPGQHGSDPLPRPENNRWWKKMKRKKNEKKKFMEFKRMYKVMLIFFYSLSHDGRPDELSEEVVVQTQEGRQVSSCQVLVSSSVSFIFASFSSSHELKLLIISQGKPLFVSMRTFVVMRETKTNVPHWQPLLGALVPQS